MLRSAFVCGFLCAFLVDACPLLAGARAPLLGEPPAVVVRPVESGDLFSNPGMGWQTFHSFADEDPNLRGLPSSSAYFRLYWSEVEPREGEVDFARIDGLLARARKAGQKLALRIMCAGTDRQEMYVPGWLREKGCPGFDYTYEGRGPKHWVPDMDSPLFLDAHFRCIQALGGRYDGHPDLDLVDIGTVGLWGEWHMSGTGVEVPSLPTRLQIIDEWCRAFRKTPKVMLIGDEAGMKHAVGKGCGWRADCLGDMGGFSKTWNHMEHFYRQQIEKTGCGKAWERGPVAFESCWDLRKWVEEGWNVRSIFDYALDLHASHINNKSAPIPAEARGEVERLLAKLGYRLVLRRLEHPRSVEAGGSCALKMEWENVGVAPPYRDHRLAVRLRKKPAAPAGGAEVSRVLVTDTSILGWRPGRIPVEAEAALPADLPPGTYELSLGVVEAGGERPAVRLAIQGRGEDGWYVLSELEVSRKP